MALAGPYTRSFDGAQGLYLQAAYSYGGLEDVLPGSTGSAARYLCEAGAGYDGPSGLGTSAALPKFRRPRRRPGAAASDHGERSDARRTVNAHGGRVDLVHVRIRPDGELRVGRALLLAAGISDGAGERVGAISGLSAGTSYHFRVVVGYSGGSAAGGDATFGRVGRLRL